VSSSRTEQTRLGAHGEDEVENADVEKIGVVGICPEAGIAFAIGALIEIGVEGVLSAASASKCMPTSGAAYDIVPICERG
jgi:hypothetical protein